MDYNYDNIINDLYVNPLDETPLYIICGGCGEKLYDGDTYYPELGVCEWCICDYKSVVDIPLDNQRDVISED